MANIKLWMVILMAPLLPLCSGLASEHDIVYHITPTLSDPCPVTPCLTLSQFARRQVARVNTTLVFLPGKHSLESKISVSNISTLLMLSKYNHSGTQIACNQSGRLTFTNVHSVHISGLNFIECAGNRVENVENFILEDSNFLGPGDDTATDGAALELYSSSVVILRCSFKLYSGSILPGHSIGYTKKANASTEIHRIGGAVVSINSTTTILASRFERNSADIGGVIALYRGSLKILDKCKFSYNQAYSDGGVINIYQGRVSISKGNSFNGNSAQNDGGVIYAFESDVLISGVNNFDSNTAHDGGAINTYEGNLIISYGNTFSKNEAHKDGGAIFAYQCNTNISEGNIFSNNMAANDGGALHTYQQNLSISDANFLHNKASYDGGAIWAHETNSTTTRNVYIQNNAGNRGGVCNIYKGHIEIYRSNLSHNEASDGGAIYADMGRIVVENTTLMENSANIGGALHTYQGDTFIVSANFNQNTAQKYGGGWLMREGNATVLDSVFEQNSASDQGGTWHMEDSSVTMGEIIITGSSASTGAAMYSTRSTLNASKSLLISGNTAHSMGTIYLVHSSFKFGDKIEFLDNYGSLVMFNSNATFMGSAKIIDCSEPVRSHDQLDIRDHEGGAVTLFKSRVIFGESTQLLYSYADDGGAVHAVESEVYVRGEILIANNTANKTGGGIYLFQSVLNCQQNCSLKLLGNEAVEKGGGMHAVNSTLNIELYFNDTIERNIPEFGYSGSTLSFVENKAESGRGGGLYLDVYAKLYVKLSPLYTVPSEIINFTRNLAKYGGGMYTSHASDTGICHSPKFRVDSRSTECPIQTMEVNSTSTTNLICSDKASKMVHFYNNSASGSGSSLYSEVKIKCNLRFFNEDQCITPISLVGTDNFKSISNIKNQDIGSKPADLCFCKDGKPDCNHHPGPLGVSNGTSFSFEVIAVDQVGHPVDGIIHNTLLRIGGYLGDGQEKQIIHRNCTKVTFNVFSPNEGEVVKMHVENSNVKLTQIIQFTACDSCPIGFNKTIGENNICKCGCDPKLRPYITTCNASREVVTREGEFWITYINTSDVATSGYLIYPFCPYNYCLPPTSTVEINLNLPDGADSQCADGRSGLLCGQCQSGLSLSLGSSRCIPCSNTWPVTLLVMLIAGLLAGVILVVLLMSINLTVAVGTLNSIIFYANIVQANNSIFLPFSKPNIATVFISSLNLEIGFDTCFFKGIDAYWKTLLNLVIPFYVIFLVIVIIFTTEHSTRFAKLLARKNPVATLATLVLLSYSKQLQTVIASLSFAILEYPDGSRQTIWLPDASVEYLKGKHIVLFIISILILLVGGLYTTLLFTWQWLLRHQDKMLLRWMKYQKLCHFTEPYHAPYNFSQRYWFGLLLIARIPVYIISAVTKDPRFKLLSTIAVIVCLLLVKVFSFEKQIYRRRLLDILDTIMLVNVISFAALTWYTFDIHPNQQMCTSIAYLSVIITIVLLMCVVLYHMLRFTRLFSLVLKAKKFIAKLRSLVQKKHSTAADSYRFPDDTSDTAAIVTYSTIELTECATDENSLDSVRSGHNDRPEEDTQSHSTSNSSNYCALRLDNTLSE